jgi:hypothetical protein
LLRPAAPIAAVALCALSAAGCGGGGEPTARVQAARAKADPERKVIAGWADTLRRSDVEGATRYFGVPLIIEQGGNAIRLRSLEEVRTFNASLPCGARLTGISRAGGYVIGTFRLGERPGKRCDGPGNLARVAIVVRGGKIREWRQIPELVTPEAPPADAETSGLPRRAA